MTDVSAVKAIISELGAIYQGSVENLQSALEAFIDKGTRPSAQERSKGCFAYPELRLRYDKPRVEPAPARAFARLNQPGTYASTIAQPSEADMIRPNLKNQ